VLRHFGLLDPQKGSIEFLGKPIQRMEADKIVAAGLKPRAGRARGVSVLSVRENLMMGAYPRKDRDGVAEDSNASYGYFPRLKGAHHQRRTAFRAASSNAGDRAGADETPTLLLLDERRSPVADPGEGIFTIIKRSTRSRMGPSSSSRTPRWRWRRHITAMCWKSAGS